MSRGKIVVAFRMGVTYHRGVTKKKLPPDIREYFVRMGRKGGALGGKARAERLSPEQRSESARKAVLVRWRKETRPQKQSNVVSEV